MEMSRTAIRAGMGGHRCGLVCWEGGRNSTAMRRARAYAEEERRHAAELAAGLAAAPAAGPEAGRELAPEVPARADATEVEP